MDLSIIVFLKKALPKIWLAILFAVVGFGAAHYYTTTLPQTYYSELTLIGLNTDLGIWGAVSLDDMNMSRRVTSDYLAVAYSQRVARTASVELSKYGHSLTSNQLRSMVYVAADTNNIMTLRVTSPDPNIVVDVANEMADAFVTAIDTLTGQHYISVLDYAESVFRSSTANENLYRTAGAVGGLLIGLVIIFLIITLNKRISMVEDVLNVKNTKNVLLIPHHSIKY